MSKGGVLKAMDLGMKSSVLYGGEKWHLFGFDAVTTRLCLLLGISPEVQPLVTLIYSLTQKFSLLLESPFSVTFSSLIMQLQQQ